MSSTQPTPAGRQLPRGHLLVLNRSFRRTLEAENKSPGPSRPTPTPFGSSPATANPRPAARRWRASTRTHPDLHRRTARPLEAGDRPQPHRGLHAFFKWAVAEGDPGGQPDGGDEAAATARATGRGGWPEQLTRLLKTCEGRDLASRRDTAIILLLVDTGMRRAECAGMTLDDVDLDQRIVWVLGKGRRPRALPIGRKTAQALDRTCGPGKGIDWPTCRTCGSAATGP
jgi:integrase